MYVTTLVGPQYQDWKPGDKVVITTPTGSGKTTFVLRSLLPHAMTQGKHIIYICNRKVLHDQFTVDSRRWMEQILETTNLTDEEAGCLHVTTYQYCEKVGGFPAFPIKPDLSNLTREERAKLEYAGQLPKATILQPEDIWGYIFDEAHYFLADSRFNAATNYWANVSFEQITAIFLTATPEPLLCFLRSRMGGSTYNQLLMIREISDLLKTRDRIRHQPPKLRICPGKEGFTPVFPKQADISRSCRQIQPYERAFNFITASHECDSGLPNTHFYPLEADYSYLQPRYFNDFSDLLDPIAASVQDETWLVFVDNERDGVDLMARLEERGCSAEYLSAQTRRTKGSTAYCEFVNIVELQSFDCQVLIATSVLDCGVSITDSRVKHIAIGHSEKTEFLQMLGRRRVVGGESIKLYVRYYTPQAINCMKSLCEKDIRFMVNFAGINEIGYDKIANATETWDGMRSRSELTADEINRTIQRMTSGRNPVLVYNKAKIARADWPGTGPYENPKYKRLSKDYLEAYTISTTAFLQSLCLLNEYSAALEEYQQTHNPLFYLERQLSWLGFSYDEHLWIGYEERMDELLHFLEQYTLAGIPKEEQSSFAQECLEHILKLPMPIRTIYKDRSRYERGTLKLGMKRMNQVFREIGIPYTVTSKQAPSGSRKAVWFVRHV